MTLEYDFMSADDDDDFVGVVLRLNVDDDKYGTDKPLDTKASGCNIALANSGYSFEYKITRQSLYKDANGNDIYEDALRDNTFMYNNLYKVELKYRYTVPLFGKQVYPITSLVY